MRFGHLAGPCMQVCDARSLNAAAILSGKPTPSQNVINKTDCVRSRKASREANATASICGTKRLLARKIHLSAPKQSRSQTPPPITSKPVLKQLPELPLQLFHKLNALV